MPIRAVTFDFWRTLFENADGERRQLVRSDAFAHATGVPKDNVEIELKKIWRIFDKCHQEEQRTLEAHNAVRMAAETFNVEIKPDVADELTHIFATAILKHAPVPVEGSLDAVKAAAKHYRVGVISDTTVSPGYSLAKLLERHGFMEYISSLSFSDEVGVAKPQAAIYMDAAKKLDVEISELLHIGDLEYTDIVGAKSLGATAALFTAINPEFKNATTADYTFATWSEFAEALPFHSE